MEEVQTILSAGAGGSTKLVADGGKRMQRIFNFKYPNEYIQRFAVPKIKYKTLIL